MNRPARLAVFVSGGGTNLQSLLDHFNRREPRLARVELVIASRPGIQAIARAESAGVAVVVVDSRGIPPDAVGEAMLSELDAHRIDLVVLAGYVKLVPPSVVARFRGAIVNIHPALLPAFGGPGMYGQRVHEAVIASGARVSGATVHLVDDRYDEGRIIAQWPVPVSVDDTPHDLADRVLRVEHLLLPIAIESLVESGTSRGGIESFEIGLGPAPSADSIRRLNP